MKKDNNGRGPQTPTATPLKLWVEIFSTTDGPFPERIKKVGAQWLDFSTHCTDPADIEEELNAHHYGTGLSYDLISITQ